MPSILIIVENLPVPLDYRVWLIATTLRDAGYDVSVISPASDKYPPGEFFIDDIKVYRQNIPQAEKFYQYFWEYSVALIKEFFLSIKIYRKNKFKIIHACNPPDILWFIALFWKIFGVKFIFDHHDLSPEVLLAKNVDCQRPGERSGNQQKLSIVKKIVYKLLLFNERLSYKFADVVLATNESFKKIAVGRNGCNPEKVFVVRTGPRLSELPPENFLNTKKEKKIAYVGVMAKQDGVDVLLKSVNYAIKILGKNFKLILMGEGPEFRNLKILAQKLELDNYVEFLGFVPRNQMIKRLASCLLGVTPDLSGPMNDHSTMLKVMDYMVCGLPQVMFDLPENRATAGASALIVPSDDEKRLAEKIIELIENEKLRQELGAAARARAESLAWEKSGAINLIAAYSRVSDN